MPETDFKEIIKVLRERGVEVLSAGFIDWGGKLGVLPTVWFAGGDGAGVEALEIARDMGVPVRNLQRGWLFGSPNQPLYDNPNWSLVFHRRKFPDYR